jgi:GT2 family glycosyltransferase
VCGEKKLEENSVAIILLNWNAYNDTFECLKSLEKLNYPNFHVFLVDNCSQDGSDIKLQNDILNKKFNLNITFIQSGGNLGFAGGNNIGIRRAYNLGYNYFWLLNNDTIVDSNSLKHLIDTLKGDPLIGIVGSKIYYYNTNILWYAGGLVDISTGRVKHIGLREVDQGQFNRKKEVDFANGCSMAFTRKLIDEIGYMDEGYFLYYEETDWNIRAKKKGFKVVYVPESVVYHKISSSSGGESNLSPYVYYYNIRNAFLFVNKNYEGIKFKAYLYMFYRTIKQIFKYLKTKDNITQKTKNIKIIYSACVDAIKMKYKFRNQNKSRR